MGIPKFFRYISERYPATSQLIAENKIPEFDNLYLDFNGIIHNCSHPNDEDAHFRLSEEEIFTAIFSYVDMLFAKIQPKKLFFMAVDGVAPRAKMNQQRSRRFRTVKEAKEVREKALANGEKLPEEKAFDSNCITPGTPFMARLSDQLRYFINKKITEDSAWRGIEVILSGHEVPGEGEHKIMEYIRLSKAQPEYNPNVRHCLYGLDADLIMLGLLSHDPHFCLLREEVKFGPARKKANHSSEAAKFYLLHLSLMREYLNLEFHDIHAKLTFDYSLERVIDDFILLAVFVGNDFLPHLPDLHIHENGLEKLFEVYKKVLPSLDGYLNEGGAICTPRLQVILDEMKAWEKDVFEKEYADSNWYKGKQSQHIRKIDESRKRAPDVLSQPQKIILDEVKSFILENRKAAQTSRLTMPNTLPARDRKFITKLAEDLNLIISWDEYDDEDQNLVVLEVPTPETDEDTEGKENDGLDVESNEAVDRVLKKYEKLRVAKEDEEGDFDTRHEQVIQEKMNNWKREYYQEKLEISFDDPEQMGALIFRYVEGLQWVMHYYYSGVASWGWFYNYHYAPRISDLTNVDKMSFHFELGRPFKPYEQLMGVLPEASNEHIPLAYRDLMSDPNSPILDFYPQEFTQDMNGKKQEWEAVVKIPFIDEARLLKAMSSREHRLTKEERQRNSFANSLIFTYSDSEPTLYPSSLPGFFPALPRCTCKMEPFNLPTLDGLHLIPGLCDGVALGVDALAGFPSLQTLPYVGMLGYHGVNVHGSESKNKSMVIHITNPFEDQKTETIAQDTIGKRTFIGWPFLREGMVVAVSDRLFKYEKVSFGDGTQKRVLSNPHTQSLGLWASKAEKIEHQYSKRLGVVSGPVEVLLHVRPLKGLIRHDNGAFVKEYEGPDKETEQAIQMAVPEVVSEDPRFIEKDPPPLHEEFPKGCNVFFLGEHAYGAAAQITNSEENTLTAILAFSPDEVADNQKFKDIVNNKASSRYLPAYVVAQQLNMSGYSLSKITSSLMVLNAEHQKINLGLSLKFEAKSLKVIGYSRKDGRAWEFSDQAISLIREYKQQYPEVFAQLSSSGDSLLAATDIWPGKDAEVKLKEVRTWLTTKGVRDLEPVSLFCDQLDKGTVSKIFSLEDELVSKQDAAGRKKAMVKGIPRQAVLKPSHALYRLNNQSFALGDRVVMVQDSGSIPLGIKGVVVGLSAKSMDVVWDVPFMSGNTLGNRCPQYRGSVVDFNSCLNLTKPQSVVSTNPNTPAAPIPQRSSFKPRIGPHPVVSPNSGQPPAAGFRGSSSHPSQASAPRGSFTPVRIMSNPQRGRGGPANGHAWTNGRNTVQGNDTSAQPAEQSVPSANANANVATSHLNHLPPKVNVPGHSHGPPPHRGGQPPFTNGGSPFRGVPRGRGGFVDRGRGFIPRGSRGRGRGTQ